MPLEFPEKGKEKKQGCLEGNTVLRGYITVLSRKTITFHRQENMFNLFDHHKKITKICSCTAGSKTMFIASQFAWFPALIMKSLCTDKCKNCF